MTLTNDFIADPCGFEICRNTITEPPCIIPILWRRWNFDRLSAKRRGIPFVGAAREEIEDDRHVRRTKSISLHLFPQVEDLFQMTIAFPLICHYRGGCLKWHFWHLSNFVFVNEMPLLIVTMQWPTLPLLVCLDNYLLATLYLRTGILRSSFKGDLCHICDNHPKCDPYVTWTQFGSLGETSCWIGQPSVH